jgi:hypothetical protein
MPTDRLGGHPAPLGDVCVGPALHIWISQESFDHRGDVSAAQMQPVIAIGSNGEGEHIPQLPLVDGYQNLPNAHQLSRRPAVVPVRDD